MLVAMELQAILKDLGYEVVGLAADAAATWSLLRYQPDLALVDLNLRDGPTGAEIARRLVREHDVRVLFMTANPRLLGDGLAGVIGVLSKPCDEAVVAAAVAYALHRSGANAPPPPPALRTFGGQMAG